MALDDILHRKPKLSWEVFFESPWPTVAKTLYARRTLSNKSPSLSLASCISVVCISDTHNTQPELPDGDILVHAGDLTVNGTVEELSRQLDWLSEQSHRHKIVVAGNHDICLDPRKSALLSMVHLQRNDWRWDSITYLEDSFTTIQLRGGRILKIYGSPWTKVYGNWAFQFAKGNGRDHFEGRVDIDTDILITHSPPQCHLDLAEGDESLPGELWRVRPKLHCFGHMHGGHGRDILHYDRLQNLYERVYRGQAGLLAVIWMAWLLLWHIVFPSEQNSQGTIVVNAAVVGGRTNEERRRVQVVWL